MPSVLNEDLTQERIDAILKMLKAKSASSQWEAVAISDLMDTLENLDLDRDPFTSALGAISEAQTESEGCIKYEYGKLRFQIQTLLSAS